jgi:hypothetical protein
VWSEFLVVVQVFDVVGDGSSDERCGSATEIIDSIKVSSNYFKDY